MARSNPIQIPTRYEIRPLTIDHLPWARAILTHSNIFRSPVWSKLYPSNQTVRAYRFFTACERLMTLNITSGLSSGVFDKEYVFKRPESAATDGKLYWDFDNLSATGEDLLEQMDFPLVSIAMAQDAAEPGRDVVAEWGPVIEAIPRLGTLFEVIDGGDKRDERIWKPQQMGEVVWRGGTSTRADYEGRGLAKMLGHWCMWQWKGEGYRGMMVGVAHPAVVRIFTNPPEGMKGEIVARLDTLTYKEVGENGAVVRPFEVVRNVPCVRIWVDL